MGESRHRRGTSESGSVPDQDERVLQGEGDLSRQDSAAHGDLSFPAIANSIDQMIWSTRPDGFHDYYNDRWYEFTGVPLGSTDGDGWNKMFHPDDRKRAWEVWSQSLATGAPYHIEYRLRYKSGQYRWVIGRAQCVRDKAGRITRWYGTCTDIHDLKTAEEQIRRNHDTFYNLIQNNPFGIYVVDADFRLAVASQGSQKVFRNVKPLIGRDFAEVLRIVWAEPFASEAIGRFRHTLRTGEAYSSPQTVERRGDVEVVEAYDWRIERMELPDGRHGIVCYFYDLSERERLEAALRENEARLAFLDQLGAETASLADADAVLETTTRLLGEHLKVSICAYADMDEDQDGFTIRGDWAAPPSKSIVGHYSLADFGKLAVKNLSAGLPLVVNDNQRELPPEESVTFQTIGIAATICMPLVKEGRLAALMAVHDRLPRVWTEAELGLVREVTARSWAHVERVAATADLRESEARLARALDAGELGAWELDLATLAAWRSPQHDRVFGYETPLAEWTYDEFLEHVVPEDRGLVDAKFHHAINGGGRWDFECRIRRADGAQRWIWAQGMADFGADGKPERIEGMVRDVTDRKRIEERLRELNETLEVRVAERTGELEEAHEQLRQSQKLEAMGQLTGGVAHDFNNLLTPIVGTLDRLKRTALGTAREQRLIDGVLLSAERASTLVQRLLAFARRQPLLTQAVDVGELVKRMAELVASTSGPRVTVQVDIADDLPTAQADANQVEMAILNLCVNGRDAMPNPGTLTISAKPAIVEAGSRVALAPGRYVQLSVADTGAGMDEATLNRAVEPFFSTKGIGKGTGLGLSMVHGLAAQLGGGLFISSKPGLGTCVDLWIPASDELVPSQEEREIVGANAAAGTALLVDDEELVRASTADMLAELGYTVVEASSSEEALRLLKGGLAFNILVTDHLMPGLSGIELAQEVRRQRPDAAVLVVSGYADDDGVALDLPRLAKPYRRADLAAKLADLDQGRRR